MSKRLSCAISSITYFNTDTRRVVLDLPEGQTLSFKAGQYLEVILPGKRCPFSIANSPHISESIELHVRPTPDSEDSVEIEALLDKADKIEIEAPKGDCYLESPPDKTLILLAASTGITQMKSIYEYLMHIGHEGQIFLYWGVLAESDLYLDNLCNAWSHDNSVFEYIPVVSEPDTSPDWNGRTGLVGDAALKDFDDLTDVIVYVSGGPGMVYATLDSFIARGMPKANMFSDVFSYAPRT
ncbi:MAG TPA: NAD(P)H-flavin reductase [Gammaproteobacteria bacterium]|nr:NAD(P)H-flavin reductase [Gammaproteobacteria bacterium]|tara:strand:+ start:1623 stop:2342 length:720 start_codon:yes stop_codon:yes gene_type:complete